MFSISYSSLLVEVSPNLQRALTLVRTFSRDITIAKEEVLLPLRNMFKLVRVEMLEVNKFTSLRLSYHKVMPNSRFPEMYID